MCTGMKSTPALSALSGESVYSAMTPFNYCCLIAGNGCGRIEFLDIGTKSVSYHWDILPHSKLRRSRHSALSRSMDDGLRAQRVSMDDDHGQSGQRPQHHDVPGHWCSGSGSARSVTAIAVRPNQREVAVGLSDGQIVILDLRNGFVVESFHRFRAEMARLFWSDDNVLIALCRDEGLWVFDCNQISRLYLKSTLRFRRYPRRRLFDLDTAAHCGSTSSSSSKGRKSKLVSISGSGPGSKWGSKSGSNLKLKSKSASISTAERSKLHQQISKKLVEIGDAQNGSDHALTLKSAEGAATTMRSQSAAVDVLHLDDEWTSTRGRSRKRKRAALPTLSRYLNEFHQHFHDLMT